MSYFFRNTTANIHDSRCGYLIDTLSRIKPGADIITDKGDDVSRLLKYSKDLDINLICPLNKLKAKAIELEKLTTLIYYLKQEKGDMVSVGK